MSFTRNFDVYFKKPKPDVEYHHVYCVIICNQNKTAVVIYDSSHENTDLADKYTCFMNLNDKRDRIFFMQVPTRNIIRNIYPDYELNDQIIMPDMLRMISWH